MALQFLFIPLRIFFVAQEAYSDDVRKSPTQLTEDFSLLCADGIPLLLDDDQPKRCHPRPWKAELKCPHGFWCHDGLADETRYCCPKNRKVSNQCHLPSAVGVGRTEYSRFYYDWRSGRCKHMVYTGLGGNQNNFPTVSACMHACKESGKPLEPEEVLSEIEKTVRPKRPLPETTTVSSEATTTSIETIPEVSQETTTKKKKTKKPKVPKTTTKVTEKIAPKTWPTTLVENTKGETKMVTSTKRTRPPSTTTQMLTTEELLTSTEAGTTPVAFRGNPCSMSPDKGVAGETARVTRWYFDASVQNCVEFTFLGNGGNYNRFESFDQCLETCGQGKLVKTSCFDVPIVGFGHFQIPRWHFDVQKKKCVKFFYSGTGGNDNRFLTKRKCDRVCVKGNKKQSQATVHASIPTEIPDVQVTSSLPGATRFSHLGSNSHVRPVTTTRSSAAGGTVDVRPSSAPPPIFPTLASSIDRSQLITQQPPYYPHTIQPGGYVNQNTVRPDHQSIPLIPDLRTVAPNFSQIPAERSPCLRPLGSMPMQTCQSPHNICPSGMFCQLADGQGICCPVIEMSPCMQIAEPGVGPFEFGRWYFDSVTNQCAIFAFRGFQGNQNNYLTFEECQLSCGGRNPCRHGTPVIPSQVNNRCSPSAPSSCPTGSVCLVDDVTLDSVCCTFPLPAEFTFSKRPQGHGLPVQPEWPTPSVPTLLSQGPESVARANPCEQAMDAGYGGHQMRRFFFDVKTATCQSFTYLGQGGNANNFMSMDACRMICPEFLNSCPSGEPLLDASNNAVFCGGYGGECPSGTWCHRGTNRSTTVCCSEAYDPCSLPLSVGLGSEKIARFYYNDETRECEQFTYTGYKGNQNNFATKLDCETACPVVDNPCSKGMPAMDQEGYPLACSTVSDECPQEFYCHVGATSATTLCCPTGGTDPCASTLSRGTGVHVLNRWYYEKDTKLCASFVYSGKGGNNNNFLSKVDCQQACPEFRSPCAGGLPHIDMTGQFTKCSKERNVCPTTYWCHIGAVEEENVCCPGASDPCEQPMIVGDGAHAVSRFTYDPLTRTCRQFFYSGSGGNENSFLTKNDCEKRCPVLVNPCRIGEPQLDDAFSHVHCTSDDDSACSEGYFCHVGTHEHTTVCCPGKAEQPCHEDMVQGNGIEQVQRFYFSAVSQQCLPFVYNGLGGSQNNFLSKIECEIKCPVLSNPCPNGLPATSPAGEFLLCNGGSSSLLRHSCPAGFWCHVGDEDTVAVCCPGASDPCNQPISPGSGHNALPRFYYDAHFRKCVRFTYTGSGGNQNNFESLEQCQQACPEFVNPCAAGDPAMTSEGTIASCSDSDNCDDGYFCHRGQSEEYMVCCPKMEDVCSARKEPGEGEARMQRWYYDGETRSCNEFRYLGRAGNENNFISEEECWKTCPVFINPCSNSDRTWTTVQNCHSNPSVCGHGEWCHPGHDEMTTVCCPEASSDVCRLPLAQGVSSPYGPFTRFFFNPESDRCEPFQYTGLKGNQNNFLTLEMCQTACPSRRMQTDPCSEPVQPGSGPQFLTRYYYHSQLHQCLPFVYTGVGGNRNSFEAMGQCVHRCIVEKDKGSHEASSVLRFGAHPSVRNSTKTVTERPFSMHLYPTLAPVKALNSLFPEERLCPQGEPLMSDTGVPLTCSVHQNIGCPRAGHVCIQMSTRKEAHCCPSPSSFCLQPQNTGQCAARSLGSVRKYTYNPITDNCVPFVYSGCGGNLNNFPSRISCSSICCNKGYNFLFKHKMLLLSDSPVDEVKKKY